MKAVEANHHLPRGLGSHMPQINIQMVMMCMATSNKKAADLSKGGESSQGIQRGGDAKKTPNS
jgi:hypothetical protein